MKKNLSKFVPFFIGVTLILSSCGSSGEDPQPKDETKPVIETPSVPAENEVFSLNGNVHYKGNFTDDTALKEVVFTLTSLKITKGVDDEPWETQIETVAIEGKSAAVDKDLFVTIPSDVYNGDEGYQLSVVCEDAAGNKSEEKKIKVLLR